MSDKKIRLRFAPSPTGPLHMGGVRTALYSYLFAKQQGGDFVLRIEDTDQTRFVPGAEQYIIESLKWCGIEPNEGVGFGDGPYAPYRQSDRKPVYKQYAEQMVASGRAYYAFDTAEEMDALRKEAEANKRTFAYDATTRMNLQNSLALSAEEVEKRKAEGQPYVIRLKVTPGEEITFTDLIRGEVTFKSDVVDDKVLLKADGMPTYHLAHIVDDYLMKITHAVRGEEWLPVRLRTSLYIVTSVGKKKCLSMRIFHCYSNLKAMVNSASAMVIDLVSLCSRWNGMILTVVKFPAVTERKDIMPMHLSICSRFLDGTLERNKRFSPWMNW
jgi:glutamyl-tRNA synthetase